MCSDCEVLSIEDDIVVELSPAGIFFGGDPATVTEFIRKVGLALDSRRNPDAPQGSAAATQEPTAVGRFDTEPAPEDLDPYYDSWWDDLDDPCGPDCTCFEDEDDEFAEEPDLILDDGTALWFEDFNPFEQQVWHAAYSAGVKDGISTVESLKALAEPEPEGQLETFADFICGEVDDLEERITQILEGVDARLDAQQLEISEVSERVTSLNKTASIIWGNQLIGGGGPIYRFQ